MKPKKSNKNKQKLPILLAFALIFPLFSLLTPLHASALTTDIISPGIYVLAEQNSMAMAGLVGSSIRFEVADFARAVNLPTSSISEVKFCSVPPISDGELRVGSTVLTAGQTVSASNLHLLSFVPSGKVTTSSFEFSLPCSSSKLSCDLYMLDKINYCPTLSVSSSAGALSVSTYCNTKLFGRLNAYDPDGDELTLEIVSYPKSGLLELTDRHTGEYTYTPLENAAGKDSFTYVARDKYGNYSAAATVSLKLVKSSSSQSFADTKNSPYENAALAMTEAGIMSGTQVGSELYFNPDDEVSRAEFVVLAMNSLGVKSVSGASCEVFSDCDDIPAEMRGYIEAAYKMGYIKGVNTENGLCFEPTRAITRAEAALIMSNMLGSSLPTSTLKSEFSDSADIPTWAEASLYSLSAEGYLMTEDNSVKPQASLTRGDAAYMLMKGMR